MLETHSTTLLFKVPKYSSRVQMRPGSALKSPPFYYCGFGYRVKVYPAGFDENQADFVAVFVAATDAASFWYAYDIKVRIEILGGGSGEERTVFDNHTAGSEQVTLPDGRGKITKGYARFVKRRELEASSCIRGDCFTIRCKLSVDVPVKIKSPRSSTVGKASSAVAPHLSDQPAEAMAGSHSLTIRRFSALKAALRVGECVHSTQFRLGGSSWYFKVYPNGHSDATSKGGVSFFLARGGSVEPATTAEFGFEVVDFMEVVGNNEFKMHTFDHDHPESGFRYKLILGDDRLLVRCHLRVIKVETPTLLPDTAPTIVPAVPPYKCSDGFEHLKASTCSH